MRMLSLAPYKSKSSISPKRQFISKSCALLANVFRCNPNLPSPIAISPPLNSHQKQHNSIHSAYCNPLFCKLSASRPWPLVPPNTLLAHDGRSGARSLRTSVRMSARTSVRMSFRMSDARRITRASSIACLLLILLSIHRVVDRIMFDKLFSRKVTSVFAFFFFVSVTALLLVD